MEVETVADAGALAARLAALAGPAGRGGTVLVDMAPWVEATRPVLTDGVLVLAQELVGLATDDPRRWRNRAAAALGRAPQDLVVPEVDDPFLRHEPAWFDDALAELGGLDLAVLTLGANGSVAGIEPGTPLDAPTHRVRRSSATVRASAVTVPWAVTVGPATLATARRVVLVAAGPGADRAVRPTVDGPVTTAVPATALRSHPDVRLLRLGTPGPTDAG